MGHKQLNGGLMPGGRLRMEKLGALISSGKLDVSKLSTHVFHGWEHIPEALQLMKDKPAELIKPASFSTTTRKDRSQERPSGRSCSISL